MAEKSYFQSFVPSVGTKTENSVQKNLNGFDGEPRKGGERIATGFFRNHVRCGVPEKRRFLRVPTNVRRMRAGVGRFPAKGCRHVGSVGFKNIVFRSQGRKDSADTQASGIKKRSAEPEFEAEF